MFFTIIGNVECLKEYETSRQRYNVPKLVAIDLIQKVAGHQWPPLLVATNAALQISDAIPQIKVCSGLQYQFAVYSREC